MTKAPAEALSAVGAVEAKANSASPTLRAKPGGNVAMTETNIKTDSVPLQKLCSARSAISPSSPGAARLRPAQTR